MSDTFMSLDLEAFTAVSQPLSQSACPANAACASPEESEVPVDFESAPIPCTYLRSYTRYHKPRDAPRYHFRRSCTTETASVSGATERSEEEALSLSPDSTPPAKAGSRRAPPYPVARRDLRLRSCVCSPRRSYAPSVEDSERMNNRRRASSIHHLRGTRAGSSALCLPLVLPDNTRPLGPPLRGHSSPSLMKSFVCVCVRAREGAGGMRAPNAHDYEYPLSKNRIARPKMLHIELTLDDEGTTDPSPSSVPSIWGRKWDAQPGQKDGRRDMRDGHDRAPSALLGWLARIQSDSHDAAGPPTVPCVPSPCACARPRTDGVDDKGSPDTRLCW
ncbi:hypothetical protein B0H10DRAFT_2218786 [Mycena sp. CBHHK59/15]|nr:hypothetical protein B0H10DRAFT_2218786 [Mycena sp. CBHHK59/15]